MEKHRKADTLRAENDKARERDAQLRQEKDHLRLQDAQKKLEHQKWQMNQRKLKILDKHIRIGERLNSLKSGRAHLQECSRMANELRVQRGPGQGSSTLGGAPPGTAPAHAARSMPPKK